MTVAQEIHVRAVVMGNVTSQGESLRVYVELIDAEKNSTLWGDTYTRPRSALYELEETLSKEIADALGIQLSGEEEERLGKRYTDNSEAHEAYLKGRYALAEGDAADYREAVRYFEEAIERDDDYSAAYAALAQTYFWLSQRWGAIPAEEAMPRAEELASRALEIDSALAEALTTRASIKRAYYWDWEGAEKDYKRALELDPSSSLTYAMYAFWMTVMGRHEEATSLARRAIQLDPSSLNERIQLEEILYRARRYEEAAQQAHRVLEVDPTYANAYSRLARLYLVVGRYEEAVEARKQQMSLDGASEEAVAGLSEAYASSGKDGYLRWLLDEMTERAKQEYVRPTDFADNYAQLGEKHRAFEWLEKAYEERDGFLIFIKSQPAWEPLRDDPRFQDLLRRMNLEP